MAFKIPENCKLAHVDLPVPVIRDAISPDSFDKEGNRKNSKKRIRKESALKLLVILYFLAKKGSGRDMTGYVTSTLSRLQSMINVKAKATVKAALDHLEDLGYVSWSFEEVPPSINIIASEQRITVKIPFFAQMYQRDYGGYRRLPSCWVDSFLQADNPSQMRIMILAAIKSFSSDEKHNNCSFEERIPALRKQIFLTARRRDVVKVMESLKDVIHFAVTRFNMAFRLDNSFSYSHLKAAATDEIHRKYESFLDAYKKSLSGDKIDWSNPYHPALASIPLPAQFMGSNFDWNGEIEKEDHLKTPLTDKLKTLWSIEDEKSVDEITKLSITHGFDRVADSLIRFLKTYSPTYRDKFVKKSREEFFKILNTIISNSEA